MNSVDEQAVVRAAIAHMNDGEPEAAIVVLSEALRSHPDAGRIWELLGHTHLSVGDALKAVSSLEHASCLVPLSSEARLALAAARALYEDRTPPPTAAERELRQMLRRAGPPPGPPNPRQRRRLRLVRGR